jgi:membrane associated rhomboid family serine protease
MLLPWRTDSPLRSTPWMNWLLIAANAGMYALEVLDESRLSRHWGLTGNKFLLSPLMPEMGQYFTYMFLHASPAHLIGNMLFLYIFGNNVNDKMGNLGYLAFYLAGGVAAGVGFVLTQTGAMPVIGASGAVAAVTGAYLVLFPRSNITVIYWLFFFGQFEVSSMVFIVFFFAQDLILNFFGQSVGNVAHSAHVAGTVFGFAVCMSLLAANLLPRDQFDVLALFQRWNKRRQYQSLVRQGYDPFGYVPATPTGGAKAEEISPETQRIQDMRAEISEAVAHHNLPHAAALFLQLKALDPNQVLSRQAQLDVANQLASQQFYPQAADAYEGFLRCYPNYEQIEHVQLMLGLIYARYLNQYERAHAFLSKAVGRLRGERELQLARAELERISPLLPTRL